jgi:hypothetical protein
MSALFPPWTNTATHIGLVVLRRRAGRGGRHANQPSAWHLFAPTWVDLGILTGTLGFFGLLFLTFLRWVPVIPISEMKQMRAQLAREELLP